MKHFISTLSGKRSWQYNRLTLLLVTGHQDGLQLMYSYANRVRRFSGDLMRLIKHRRARYDDNVYLLLLIEIKSNQKADSSKQAGKQASVSSENS
uniref:Uncharacterized protein n=1 Tax=Glossina palpalis gambiensis TaxID=67801 RepID=A0A1B0APH9_9MUSC